MRISDWSSDVCSSDLGDRVAAGLGGTAVEQRDDERQRDQDSHPDHQALHPGIAAAVVVGALLLVVVVHERWYLSRSEEHTSELQSLMRISYAVFCLKKKTRNNTKIVRQK